MPTLLQSVAHIFLNNWGASKRDAYIVAECCAHFPEQFFSFFSILVWKRKKKIEIGDEDGEGGKKNLKQICPYLFGILFNSFPN